MSMLHRPALPVNVRESGQTMLVSKVQLTLQQAIPISADSNGRTDIGPQPITLTTATTVMTMMAAVKLILVALSHDGVHLITPSIYPPAATTVSIIHRSPSLASHKFCLILSCEINQIPDKDQQLMVMVAQEILNVPWLDLVDMMVTSNSQNMQSWRTMRWEKARTWLKNGVTMEVMVPDRQLYR
jgi:hypothetical protein